MGKRVQNIIRILRYDFDRDRPSQAPRTMLNIPQTTSSPSLNIPQTFSPPSSAAAAAAAAVERRPIPPSGLTLAG